MPTAPSPSAGVLRRDIQGLRAVAVIAVIVFHLGAPLPGGFVGVDIFFVVSGFVITAMLMRELDRTGRIDLRAFYIRRFKRLTPALALVIGGHGGGVLGAAVTPRSCAKCRRDGVGSHLPAGKPGD